MIKVKIILIIIQLNNIDEDAFFINNENKHDKVSMIYVKLEDKLPISKRVIISLGDIHVSADVDPM